MRGSYITDIRDVFVRVDRRLLVYFAPAVVHVAGDAIEEEDLFRHTKNYAFEKPIIYRVMRRVLPPDRA